MSIKVSSVSQAAELFEQRITQELLSSWETTYPGESLRTLTALQVCFHALFQGEPVAEELRPWFVPVPSDVSYNVRFADADTAYEEALASMDKKLRHRTGTWYTPVSVVDAMCELSLEALGRKPLRVVDVASGQGAFLDGMARQGVTSGVEGWELQAVPALLYAEKMARRGNPVKMVIRNALNNPVPRKDTADIVIGNPPYKSASPTAMTQISPRLRHLMHGVNSNIYLQFHQLGSHMALPHGVLCMVHPNSSMVSSIGQEWRKRIRSMADSVWVINLSPEGDLAPKGTKIFDSIRSPLCITILANGVRPGVWYKTVPYGCVEDKIADLLSLSVFDERFVKVEGEGGDPFVPSDNWSTYPVIKDLLNPSLDRTYCSPAGFMGTSRADFEHRLELMASGEDYKELQGVKFFDGKPRSVQRVAHRPGDMRYIPVDERLGVKKILSRNPMLSFGNNNLPKNGGVVAFSSKAITKSYASSGTVSYVSLQPTFAALRALRRLYYVDVLEESIPMYILGLSGLSPYHKRFSEKLRFPGVRIPFPRSYELYKEMAGVGYAVRNTYEQWELGKQGQLWTPEVESWIVREPTGVPTRCTVEPDGTIKLGNGVFYSPPGSYHYYIGNRKLAESFISGRCDYFNGGFIVGSKHKTLSSIPHTPWSREDSEGLVLCLAFSSQMLCLESKHEQLLKAIMEDIADVSVNDAEDVISLF